MKLSALYNLNKDIDFNDLDVSTDNQSFIDPFRIKRSNTVLSKKCERKLIDFFSTAIKYIQEGKSLEEIFNHLNECNETRLGWSNDFPQGTGVSGKLGEQLSIVMNNHPLILNGVIREIEDVSIFLKDFGDDRVNDICTRVILLELA